MVFATEAQVFGTSTSLTRIFHQSASIRTHVIEFDDDIGPLPKLHFELPPALRLLVGSFVPDSHVLPQP